MASWKGAIKTLVPMGLSFIPGYGIPLAAASRALMEGVDRPGKNVLRDGVDWRSILTGGLKGASIGATTQSVAGGVKGLLAPKMAARAGAKGLQAGTKALEGLNVDLNLPTVNLQRGIFEGLTGEGGAPVTSRLATATVPKAATAARTATRAAAKALPSSSAVNMPAPQVGMGLQFPGMSDVGRSAYGGAPSFTPQTFRPGLPSSPLGGMPSAQPGPLSFMRGIGEEVPMMTQPPTGFGRAAAEKAFQDLQMPFGDIANAGVRSGAGSSNKFVQALLNPQVLGSAIQGGLAMLPDAKTAAMDAQTRLAQQQFEEEKRRTQMEEERRRRIAELLMPMAMQNFPQYFGGR